MGGADSERDQRISTPHHGTTARGGGGDRESGVQKHSVHTLVFRSLKRTHDMFLSDQPCLPPQDDEAEKIKRAIKARDQYGPVIPIVEEKKRQLAIEGIHIGPKAIMPSSNEGGDGSEPDSTTEYGGLGLGMGLGMGVGPPGSQQSAVTLYTGNKPAQQTGGISMRAVTELPPKPSVHSLVTQKKLTAMPKPKWHPPWKLHRVISGHLGWVRCVTVEPNNEWFVTGAADRVIKIWDLASGKLKLSLTGHVSTVRGLVVSPRHPYLFSCGEDRQVKCWDLEYNKVIRHYHGHLSAVYGLALHPTIDVLVSVGRDSVARVWDMRTKANIHTLSGHTNTVASVLTQAAEPQIITGSHDSTIRLWDLAAGKSLATLTNHKKSVRGLAMHPNLFMFASASTDNIKQWKCPKGEFIQNLSGHNAILNALAVNPDGVMVSGADNGSMHFWDWRTGYNFQRIQTQVQPGSMDSEAGIFAMTFDLSGTRLITTEADKTIKVYKEDDEASEESNPIDWKPDILKRRRF